MTIEKASVIIGNIPIEGDDCYTIAEYQEAKTMAINALEQIEIWNATTKDKQIIAPKGTFRKIWEDEQQPRTDVLDKIRAEIEQKQYDFMDDKDYDEGIRFGLMLAYQITDKYKKEREE